MIAKKITCSIVLLIAIDYAGILSVKAKANITTTESDFVVFVSQAGVELDLGNRAIAEYNLSQANHYTQPESDHQRFYAGTFQESFRKALYGIRFGNRPAIFQHGCPAVFRQ